MSDHSHRLDLHKAEDDLGHYMKACAELKGKYYQEKQLSDELGAKLHDAEVRLDDRRQQLKKREASFEQERRRRNVRADELADQCHAKVAELTTQRDENFQVIQTICKVMCDLECPEGCDEGLDYEGDEWAPCPCIYKPRQELRKALDAVSEARGERCETCQATRGAYPRIVRCWGPRDCIGMSDD